MRKRLGIRGRLDDLSKRLTVLNQNEGTSEQKKCLNKQPRSESKKVINEKWFTLKNPEPFKKGKIKYPF